MTVHDGRATLTLTLTLTLTRAMTVHDRCLVYFFLCGTTFFLFGTTYFLFNLFRHLVHVTAVMKVHDRS